MDVLVRDGRGIAVFGVMLLLVMAGCQQQDDVGQTEEGNLVIGQAEVTEQLQRAVAPGARLLVFDGFNGVVRLQGTEAETARLTFTKRARGQSESDAQELMGRIGVRESGNDERYAYVMRSPSPDRSAVDVTGTTPQATQLRIEVDSGPIALSGIRGPITVEHVSGSVQIGGAAASVSVTSRNGSVELGLQRVPADAEIMIETENGNVSVALPDVVSAQVEARTTAGSINTDGLNFEQRRLNPEGAGAEFEAQLGTGNATIDLRTENGNIRLYRGTVEPATPDTSAVPTPADTAATPATERPAPSPMDTSADTSAMPADPDTTR
jgi:hypothetical protein